MNKILTLILALTITSIGWAKEGVKSEIYSRNTISEKATLFDNSILNNEKSNNVTQTLNGKVLTRINHFGLSHFSNTTPVAFDVYSNTLGIVISSPVYKSNGSFLRMESYIKRSTNNGDSFSDFVLLEQESKRGLFNPSMAYVNSNMSSNFEDVSYIVYAPQNYIDSNYTREGGVFVFYNKDFGKIEEYSEGPVSDKEWGEMKLYSDYSKNTIYGYSLIEKDNPESENGSNIINGDYGFWKFGFNIDDQNQFGIIPNEWTDSRFFKGSEGDGLYTSAGEMGTDEKGNIYNVVNHLFIEDKDNRVPAFSKSVDDGLNWSEFKAMPSQLYTDFTSKFNGFTNFSLRAGLGYHPYALKVWGEDNFSFFTRIEIYNDDELRYFIVEATYDNGVWGLNEIEELNSYGPPLIYDGEPDQSGFQSTLYDGGSPIANGNNIQITETADGNNLVMFYIDNVNEEFVKFSPFQLTLNSTKESVSIDSLEKFDIYAKIYNINDGTWSEKINLTNDNITEIKFNVPHVVKDLENIHFLTYKTVRVSGYPEPIIDIIPNNGVDLIYTKLDLANLNSVENTLDFDVQLGDAYPNPAVGVDNVDISFTVEKSTLATINLYDNMGNKVSTLLDQKVPAGEKYINASISNLNSGTYYFQLNISGHTFTKKLVVVK